MSEKDLSDKLQEIVDRAKEATEPEEKLRRAEELLEHFEKDEKDERIKTFANDDIDRLIADIKNQADKEKSSE